MHDSYADRGRESAVVKTFDLSSGDAVERWVPPMSGAQMLALGVKDESKLYLATASLKWHVSFVPTCAVDPACHSQNLISRSTSHLLSHLTPGCHGRPSQVGNNIDQAGFLQSLSPETDLVIRGSSLNSTSREEGTSDAGVTIVKPLVGLVGPL